MESNKVYKDLRDELWLRLAPIFEEFEEKIQKDGLDRVQWLAVGVGGVGGHLMFQALKAFRGIDGDFFTDKELSRILESIVKEIRGSLEIKEVKGGFEWLKQENLN